jgi:hypothetical protein
MLNLSLIEILKEIGIAGLMASIMDAAKGAVKDGVKKAGDAVFTKISKEMEEEYRVRLLTFIRELAIIDPWASAQFIRRHEDRQFCRPRTYGNHKSYVSNDENKYVMLLSKLYIGLDEPEEQNARVQIFKWLGNIPDEEFDSRIEFLNHDMVIQYATRLLKKAGTLLNNIDQKAGQWAQSVNHHTQNPSRFGKIAKRLFR